MTMGLFNVESVNDIAEAINEQGVTGTFTVDEMGDAVREIEVGGGGVDVDTELSISSDKQRTTGAVTLTSELSASDYVGVSDVNLNGHLENATVKFYKMIGQSPNPSTDTLLYSGITNTNGIVNCNTSINENSSFYALFDGISGKYPTCTSNIVNVEYTSDLIFEEDYTGSPTDKWDFISGSGTLTYTTDGSDNILHLISTGEPQIMPKLFNPRITTFDNFEMEFDFKYHNSLWGGLLYDYTNSKSLINFKNDGNLAVNTWGSVKIINNNNTLQFYLNNVLKKTINHTQQGVITLNLGGSNNSFQYSLKNIKITKHS